MEPNPLFPNISSERTRLSQHTANADTSALHDRLVMGDAMSPNPRQGMSYGNSADDGIHWGNFYVNPPEVLYPIPHNDPITPQSAYQHPSTGSYWNSSEHTQHAPSRFQTAPSPAQDWVQYPIQSSHAREPAQFATGYYHTQPQGRELHSPVNAPNSLPLGHYSGETMHKGRHGLDDASFYKAATDGATSYLSPPVTSQYGTSPTLSHSYSPYHQQTFTDAGIYNPMVNAGVPPLDYEGYPYPEHDPRRYSMSYVQMANLVPYVYQGGSVYHPLGQVGIVQLPEATQEDFEFEHAYPEIASEDVESGPYSAGPSAPLPVDSDGESLCGTMESEPNNPPETPRSLASLPVDKYSEMALAVKECFPASEHHQKMAIEILKSEWYPKQELEPPLDPEGNWVVNGFLCKEESCFDIFFSMNDNHEFECQYYVKGKRCKHETNRKERARAHSRTHFDYTPYPCLGKCGEPQCEKKFTCNSFLLDHARRVKKPRRPCKICSKALSTQNVSRHMRAMHSDVRGSSISSSSRSPLPKREKKSKQPMKAIKGIAKRVKEYKENLRGIAHS